MKNFTLNPLVLAVALATLSTGASAQAPEEATEEVIVSGFRASLANGLSIKKDSVGSVDTIVAEDIGDFPDNNLADAMARLPGVNIDRVGGEGKNISVRGLSAQFSRVRINGMETVATGYANTGRAFDFNIFASELFSRIDVNKTMKAEFEEGSLGATVDLYTAHPLDSKKNTFMVNYTQGYNDLSEASDPRFTALGSMQNEEGTLGAAVSIALSKRSITQQGHNSGRWEANPISSTVPYTKVVTQVGSPSSVQPGTPGYVAEKSLAAQNNHWKVVTPAKTVLCTASGGTATENCWNNYTYNQTSLLGVTTSKTEPVLYVPTAADAALNSAVHPRFPRQMDREIDIDRVGFTGSIQWKPTDDTKLTLDVLDASLGFDQHDVNLTPISLSRTTTTGRAETTVTNYVIDPATNTLVKADLAGVDVRSENFNAETQTEFHQASLALEHNFTDSLSMKAMLGSSKANTEVTHEATAILERFNAGLTYDYRTNPQDPLLVYDFALGVPSNWKLSEMRDRPNWTTNTFDNASADFKWEINDTFSAQAGASFKKFTHDNIQLTRDTAFIDQAKTPQGSAIKAMPAGCSLTVANTAVTADMGSLFTPSNGQNTFFLADTNQAFASVGFGTNDTCFPLIVNASADRSVEEESTGYFVQGNFNTDLADMPFKGNVGVRTVKTDLASTGLLSGLDATVKRDYRDTLPSVNLSLSPLDSVTVRASWAKVMSRPSLPGLTPGGSLDNFNRKYTAGNPFLDPFRADATDLSVDWYFTEEGLISLAFFKKDIESFPQSSTLTKPFSELGLSANISSLPAAPTENYTVSSQSNGEGGKLDGIELQYQQPFTFGPDWVRDFGIKLNYTKIDSELNVGTAAVPRIVSLPGQSDNSYNGTLWYENDAGFQGRVSYTYRSAYITSSTTVSTAGTGYDTTDGVGVVDASFSYQLNESLKFTLDLINLNDVSETLLNGDAELIDTQLKSGRQVYLGASYTF